MASPDHKIISLLFRSCNFAVAVNCNKYLTCGVSDTPLVESRCPKGFVGEVAFEIDLRASESLMLKEKRGRYFVGQSQKREDRGHDSSEVVGYSC